MSWALTYSILLRGTQNSYLYPQADTERKWLAVYLARFRRNIEGIVWNRDRFAFTNSRYNYKSFEKSRYLISNTDMYRLYNVAGNNNNLKQILREQRSQPWHGSCYGMAVAVVLNIYGKIYFPGNTTDGCSEMIDIPSLISLSSPHRTTSDPSIAPSASLTEAESKINMYQLSQVLPSMKIWSTISSGGESQQLANLVDGHELGNISILNYSFLGKDENDNDVIIGHSLVCYGKPIRTYYGYKVKTYDCRYTSSNCWLEIDDDDWEGTVVSTNSYGATEREPIIDCTYCDYFECFNSNLDFDGIQNTNYINLRDLSTINISEDLEINDMPAHVVKTDDNDFISLAGKTILYVESFGAFEIENAEGQQLKYIDGEISGNLPVYCYSLLPSGENSPCTYEFIVDENSSFTCSSLTDSAKIISFFFYNDDQTVSNNTVCTITR